MLSFLFLIAVGTFLLMLPISTTIPGHASFMDAVFTATSATCVTGLVMGDTWSLWSGFGQAVILILIEIGGLGFMSAASLAFFTFRKKMSIQSQMVMAEAIGVSNLGDKIGRAHV